jgi:hypothetical protein
VNGERVTANNTTDATTGASVATSGNRRCGGNSGGRGALTVRRGGLASIRRLKHEPVPPGVDHPQRVS